MPEVTKCPVCGCRLYKAPFAMKCGSCQFQCDAVNIGRIAAAMELAKAEVAASNVVWRVPLCRIAPAVEAAEDMLFQARMRVLEVFGTDTPPRWKHKPTSTNSASVRSGCWSVNMSSG